MAKTEVNEAPEDVELGNGESPAPVQPTPPNVLQQAGLGNLDLFRTELESGNHPLDFKAGPDVYFNRTPLHLAAMEGHDEIVEFILSRPEISREVVNAKDSFGYTPLRLAVRHSLENVVSLLTTSSWVLPDIFLAVTSEPDDVGASYGGCTPLHLAAGRGDTAIATLLLRQPRQLEFAYAPVNIHAMSWIGETPLDSARKNNFKPFVEVLENSDLNYLQQERARCAMSANAILVGAALVAAATFGAWLQPPGGMPNPNSVARSPSPSPSTSSSKKHNDNERVWFYTFFFQVALAFVFSMMALAHGTLATLPIRAASLKVEVKVMREAVQQAQTCLLTAIACLMVSFSFAVTLVLHKFADFYGTSMYYVVTWLPLIVYFFVIFCLFFLQKRMGKKYSIKSGWMYLLYLLNLAFVFLLPIKSPWNRVSG